MKFQKEDAYKELVRKMTANGEKLSLSDRSINEQLETLISVIANEETELSDFVEKVFPIFKTADANVRNDVSVSIKNFRETEKETKKDKTDNSGLDGLLDRVKQLETELEEGRKRQKNEAQRKNLFDILKEKGVNDEEWLNSLLNEIHISEDFDVNAKADGLLALYNKSKSQIDDQKTPQDVTSKAKMDRINDAIKQAAEFAKSQNLIGN
jgi:ribosomal protein S15P/S13E